MRAFGEFSIPLSIYFSLIHQVELMNAAETNFPKLFSRGVANFSKLRAFPNVSIGRCGKECSRRNRCKGLLYHRAAGFCVLASKLQLDTTHSNDGETVLITGFNSDGLTSCGTTTCALTETCVEEDNGFVCKSTECGPLPSFYTNVQGNMYGRTNKLIVKMGPSDKTVTCGNSGLWEGDTAHTDTSQVCTDVFGISGVYIVSPSMREVYCDMETDEGHWLVFQRRQDGTVDFLRNWTDYVSGFGNVTGELWLGLEPLYQILQAGDYELRVDLENFSGERRYARYSTFTLTGKEDNYRLGVSGYTGNAGDSLSGHSGMMFTTRDKDNDISGRNCADTFKGAWWYSKCHASNLNGWYFPGGHNTTQYANHIHWRTWLGYFTSLKRTEMKLRRKL